MLITACQEVEFPVYPPQIVVEGWIENGASPVVMLTTNVSVSNDRQSIDSLGQHIIRWAKVSVSDGDEEVILTGKVDKNHFPPYIYTSYKIKGEIGKKYELKVEYSGRTVTASTTVPPPVSLEYVEPVHKSDSLYYLRAGFRDDPGRKDYYKFFIKVRGRDTYYKSSFLGLIDDAVLAEGDVTDVNVMGGYGLPQENTGLYFCEGDTVDVRISTMDHASYCFWSDFDEITSLSTNPFFPSTGKVRSNIKGGLGYWAGYGSTYHTVPIVAD